MPTVSTTSLSTLVKNYYDKLMLERLIPNLMFHQFGVKKELPKHEGASIIWHRWNKFGYGRNITESGPGSARGISATKISANLIMLGDHAVITNYLDMVSINSVVEGAIELFADNAALTIDFVTSRLLLWRHTSISSSLQLSAANGYFGDAWSVLTAGAHVAAVSSAKWQAPLWSINKLNTRNLKLSGINCAGGGATGLCATPITPNILRQLALKLKVRNALPFEDGYYKSIVHPDIIHQLRSSSAFVDLHKYVETGAATFEKGTLRQGQVEKGLIGVMERFKFYESTEAPLFSTSGIFGGTANGKRAQPSAYGGGRFYFSFFFGRGAYGVTDFDGGVHTYIKTPGPQTVSVPLDQYSTVGWKAIMAAKILNPSGCLWLIQGRPADIYGVGA